MDTQPAVAAMSSSSRPLGAAALHVLLLAAVQQVAVTSESTLLPFQWRNDTANLLLTHAWNALLTATPWSIDLTSPDIVDTPPVALNWSLGTDMPVAQKDGVGCWLTDIDEFVVTGGLWAPTNGSEPLGATNRADGAHLNLAYSYNTRKDTWQQLPGPPWMPGRGTGACTSNALYLVSGVFAATPNNGTDVAKLSRSAAGQWVWESLPPLPQDGYRWLGSSGVIGDYLYAAVGLSTRPVVNGGTGATSYTNTTYRLHLSNASAAAARWERVADFPSSKGSGVDPGGLAASGGVCTSLLATPDHGHVFPDSMRQFHQHNLFADDWITRTTQGSRQYVALNRARRSERRCG